MGSSNSKETPVQSYKQIRKWPHPLLGNLTQLLNPQGQTYFLKTTFQDQNTHKQAMHKLKQRKTNRHLLQIQKINQTKNQEFCGSCYKLQILLEPFHYDLEYVFNKKTVAKQPFHQEQLIEVLVACINGLLFIQDNDLKKCHLNKQSIVYSGREIKILDGGIVDKIHPFYSLMMKEKVESDIFLAPELLQDLQDNLQPYLAPKTDIFTIGMILLHLAALESLDYLYDYNSYSLDFHRLNKKINGLNYSQFFKEVLRCMLTEDQQMRLGLISVQDMLGINSRRQTVRLDTYRSHKNNHNSSRDKQTSKTESNEASFRVSKHETLRSVCKQLPNIQEQSQKNSSILSKSILKNETKSKIFVRDSIIYDENKQNKQNIQNEKNKQIRQNQTPVPKLHPNQYKLAHSIEQSPISQLQYLQHQSPSLNQQYERIVFDNGSYYEGEINSMGFMEGNGILYYSSGKVGYSGSWSQGQFQGFGTFHNEYTVKLNKQFDYTDFNGIDSFWIRYEGQFHNDCRHGFGILLLSNGQKYAGCFKNDIVDGYGTYHFANGKQINAVWKQNKLEKLCQ